MQYLRTFSAKSFLPVLLFFLFAGCSKKDQVKLSAEAAITSFNFHPGTDMVNIQSGLHLVNLQVPDSVVSGNNLTANFSLSGGANATIGQVPQESGVTKNDFDQDVIYTVTAADRITQQPWTVRVTNNDYSINWGLGHFIQKSLSSNLNYEWYTDQGSSGTYAAFNCGPASVTMAIKWADPGFTKTAQDARQIYRSDGGWWYTSDIDNYLSANNIPHAIIPLSGSAAETGNILTHQLDNLQIVILCIDMDKIRRSTDSSYRVDKFYNTSPGWGHFFVVKGYRVTDGELFFQIYDPYSLGLTYPDDSFRGKNRYYRSGDVAAAADPWWNNAFVIARKGETVNLNAGIQALDPAMIRHARGL